MNDACAKQVANLQGMSDRQFLHFLRHIGEEVKRRFPKMEGATNEELDAQITLAAKGIPEAEL